MDIFVGARVFDGLGFHDDHALVVEAGRVLAITRHSERPRGGVEHDLGGGVLAPGFVDWQVNGGGGALFNAAPTLETIRTIVEAHRRFGTTALLPTVVTDAPEKLTRRPRGGARGARACSRLARHSCRGALYRRPPQGRASRALDPPDAARGRR